MTTKYTVAGKTDERTTCENCGKKNLKMTVVLKDENGDFVFFGSQCAANALMGTKKKAKSVNWIANEMRIAKNWLDKGYSVKEVDAGLARRGVPVEIKNEKVGVWFNKVWNPIN